MKKRSEASGGYSLIEIMIALAALGLLGLGASVLVNRISNQQTQIVSRDEASEFMGALSKWISTEKGCVTALVGKTFPMGGSAPLEITGYQGYGAGTKLNATNTLGSGYRITNQLTIDEINLKDKGIAPVTVFLDNRNFRRVVAQIEVALEAKISGTIQNQRKRYVEVPVLLNEASNLIERCAGEATIADMCSAMGSIFDPATNTCKPLVNCVMQGSYMTLSCNPTSYGCFNASGQPLENPLTNAQSCPAGAAVSQTGIFNYTHQANCGKKCTATIQDELRFYICLRCN